MTARSRAHRLLAAGARAFAVAVLPLVFAGAIGCGGPQRVMRVVDGRLVAGPYVPPEAYAAFLEGAIREDSGDLKGALAAYVEAARHDESDAEIWARIAVVECRLDPHGPAANLAIARALAIDPAYAGAFGAQAACDVARGAPDDAAATRATDLDPMADGFQILRARAESGRGAAGPGDAAARDRLVALTLIHEGRPAAWEALAAWARTHGDVPLFARALTELGRRGLGRRAGLAASAESLAGEGELIAARSIAGGIADGAPASGSSLSVQRYPLVARLAVDEAIAAGDLEKTRLRAARTHVALDEAAARALLAGNLRLARELAAPVAGADPHALGARLVLVCVAAAEAFGRGDPAALALAYRDATPGDAPAPAEAVVAYGLLLSRALSEGLAARIVSSLRSEPVLAGDALLTKEATELAARGVLPDTALPLDALVELAARRSSPTPEAARSQPSAVDPRHELLALAFTEPTSPRTQALAARMAESDDDPLVAVALARIGLATHPDRIRQGASARLLDRDPDDPLLAAVALAVAERSGDPVSVSRAKTALAALARTPAERALLE